MAVYLVPVCSLAYTYAAATRSCSLEYTCKSNSLGWSIHLHTRHIQQQHHEISSLISVRLNKEIHEDEGSCCCLSLVLQKRHMVCECMHSNTYINVYMYIKTSLPGVFVCSAHKNMSTTHQKQRITLCNFQKQRRAVPYAILVPERCPLTNI